MYDGKEDIMVKSMLILGGYVRKRYIIHKWISDTQTVNVLQMLLFT